MPPSPLPTMSNLLVPCLPSRPLRMDFPEANGIQQTVLECFAHKSPAAAILAITVTASNDPNKCAISLRKPIVTMGNITSYLKQESTHRSNDLTECIPFCRDAGSNKSHPVHDAVVHRHQRRHILLKSDHKRGLHHPPLRRRVI
jgi:hypothetical protein